MEAVTTRLPYTWVLWYHDPANKNWTLADYVRIADIKTVQEFWSVVDSISEEAWKTGMFFFMKDGHLPLWDKPEANAGPDPDYGGTWTQQVPTDRLYEVFIDCMVHVIADDFLVNRKEVLTGISNSPKIGFHIVKIWNTTRTVKSPDYINPNMKLPTKEGISYTSHGQRSDDKGPRQARGGYRGGGGGRGGGGFRGGSYR